MLPDNETTKPKKKIKPNEGEIDQEIKVCPLRKPGMMDDQ
jgi:hypothetical protein